MLATDKPKMDALKGTFDAVLFTASGGDLDIWLDMLAMGGQVIMMGLLTV